MGGQYDIVLSYMPPQTRSRRFRIENLSEQGGPSLDFLRGKFPNGPHSGIFNPRDGWIDPWRQHIFSDPVGQQVHGLLRNAVIHKKSGPRAGWGADAATAMPRGVPKRSWSMGVQSSSAGARVRTYLGREMPIHLSPDSMGCGR